MSVVFWVEQLLILEMTSRVPSFACTTLLLVWEATVILQEAGSRSRESWVISTDPSNDNQAWLGGLGPFQMLDQYTFWHDNTGSKEVPITQTISGHIPGPSSSSESSGSPGVWLLVLMTAGGLTFLCIDLIGDPTDWKIQEPWVSPEYYWWAFLFWHSRMEPQRDLMKCDVLNLYISPVVIQLITAQNEVCVLFTVATLFKINLFDFAGLSLEDRR